MESLQVYFTNSGLLHVFKILLIVEGHIDTCEIMLMITGNTSFGGSELTLIGCCSVMT